MDQRINRLVDPDLRVYLVRTVRNRGASLEDAEDVVQSVLTKMLSDETREVFDRDEDTAHLGEALKLPSQHAHLRPYLEAHLQPLGD